MEVETFLYRALGDGGKLLYVGISSDVNVRISQHRIKSEWFPNCVGFDVESFGSRSDALDAEREAIANENPTHNIIHNPSLKKDRGRMTIEIRADLVREIRVACVELPPKVTGGGPSAFFEQAAEAYLETLRKEHNGGDRFEAEEEPRMRKGPN